MGLDEVMNAKLQAENRKCINNIIHILDVLGGNIRANWWESLLSFVCLGCDGWNEL